MFLLDPNQNCHYDIMSISVRENQKEQSRVKMCAREGKAVPVCYKTSAMLLIESILYLNITFVFNIIKRIYEKFIGTLFSKKYIV
jgi:hypothetical protein